ncbi:MAG: 30S ribosomal protein S4 [archaeon]
MTWIRKKKKFSKPKKMFDKLRIEEENVLVKKYGLKSKREIWKAEAQIDKIRRRAKESITASEKEHAKIFNKLNKIGIKVEKISDVLSLDKESWLKRRLQSVLVSKKMAKTPREARQLIVHKNVKINGNVVNIPGYIVKVVEEDKINVLRKINVANKNGGKKQK